MSGEVEGGGQRAEGRGQRADDEGQGRMTKGNGGRQTADGEKFLLLFRYTRSKHRNKSPKIINYNSAEILTLRSK